MLPEGGAGLLDEVLVHGVPHLGDIRLQVIKIGVIDAAGLGLNVPPNGEIQRVQVWR